MNSKSRTFRQMSLPVASLKIDPDAQRGPRRAMVNKIVANYVEEADAPILVAHRKDGGYWIVDGQQRWLAAKKRGQKVITCNVFESSGKEHEARIFVTTDTKIKIDPAEKFNIRLVAKDEAAISIHRVLESRGFYIPRIGGSTGPRAALRMVYEIEKVFTRNGATGLAEVLDLLNAIWPNEKIKREMLGGLAMFCFRYPQYKKQRLIRVLSSYTPANVLAKANARKLVGGTIVQEFCDTLVIIYNTGLQERHRLEEPNRLTNEA